MPEPKDNWPKEPHAPYKERLLSRVYELSKTIGHASETIGHTRNAAVMESALENRATAEQALIQEFIKADRYGIYDEAKERSEAGKKAGAEAAYESIKGEKKPGAHRPSASKGTTRMRSDHRNVMQEISKYAYELGKVTHYTTHPQMPDEKRQPYVAERKEWADKLTEAKQRAIGLGISPDRIQEKITERTHAGRADAMNEKTADRQDAINERRKASAIRREERASQPKKPRGRPRKTPGRPVIGAASETDTILVADLPDDVRITLAALQTGEENLGSGVNQKVNAEIQSNSPTRT